MALFEIKNSTSILLLVEQRINICVCEVLLTKRKIGKTRTTYWFLLYGIQRKLEHYDVDLKKIGINYCKHFE